MTALQNRWEAASLHWACQLSGIIMTPVNWRSKPDEIDFYIENAEAKAITYQDVSAEAVAASHRAQALPQIALDASPPSTAIAFAVLTSTAAP